MSDVRCDRCNFPLVIRERDGAMVCSSNPEHNEMPCDRRAALAVSRAKRLCRAAAKDLRLSCRELERALRDDEEDALPLAFANVDADWTKFKAAGNYFDAAVDGE